MNKKLLLLLIFPISLKAVSSTDVWGGVKSFVLALFHPDTVMFSELGDRLADPSGGQLRVTQEEIRQKAAVAAERRRRSKEEQLGDMLDELGGKRSTSPQWVPLQDLSSRK